MPTSRPFKSYPDTFAEIFLTARHAPITITESSAREARRLRDRLYAYRNAALDDVDAAGKIALISVMAKMKLEGNTLTIYYPSNQKRVNDDPSSAENPEEDTLGSSGVPT